MNRFRMFAAAAGIAATAVGCASLGPGPVSVTKSESLVAGCQKIGDVSARTNESGALVNSGLADRAREKGANWVLVTSDDARTGVAYRCDAPAPSAAGGKS